MSKTFTELIKKYPLAEDDIEELRSSVKDKVNKAILIFSLIGLLISGMGVILWLT